LYFHFNANVLSSLVLYCSLVEQNILLLIDYAQSSSLYEDSVNLCLSFKLKFGHLVDTMFHIILVVLFASIYYLFYNINLRMFSVGAKLKNTKVCSG
jgi:hypothetical protein